ncbi:MAG TPA: PP2C family serine/threonine-protein phosphatase [Pirellulales bacterium]|nr:PP2C family serine/threonine-protein phosphatase [Pirellulales bacterium]
MAETASSGHRALEHAELSDVGLRRGNNQDSFAVVPASDDADWRRRGHFFLVADGMGAHAAGELASKIASENVGHTYRKLLDRPPIEALRQALAAANATIHNRGQANAEFQGMGTTCSALVLLPRAALVAHVGDSRVYRLRGTKLEQLTFDHSLVWEMTAAGQMPSGDVANFIPKNIITRSLGPHAEVQVDLEGPFPIEAGDVYLLCSDGLSGQVRDEEIGAILSVLGPQEAVRALVDMANLRGGPDNITALVARVPSVPPEEPEAAPNPVNQPAPSPPLHPLVWIVIGAGLLAALGLFLAGQNVPAFVAVLVAGAAAVFALVQGLGSPPPAFPLDNTPRGRGPHTKLSCQPNAEAVASFCQMAQQLREAAKDEHWTLDWARFNAYGESAQAALAARDYAAAIRQYALAISFMMSEIRHQSARKDQRDSSVLDI